MKAIGKYELNQIYCGDNSLLVRELPDNSVDLVVTSPPYDNLRAYNGYSWDFETLASELFRVVIPGGIVVWVVNDSSVDGSETLTSSKQKIYFHEQCGFRIHDTMIYVKSNYMPLTKNRYEQAFEYMFVFSKGRPRTYNPLLIDCLNAGKIIKRSPRKADDGFSRRNASRPRATKDKKRKGNVWTYKVGGGKAIKHVAQFPKALARDHILSWSNPGDVVFDPFAGSGTTLAVAQECGRCYLGFEISREYVLLIKKRLMQRML